MQDCVGENDVYMNVESQKNRYNSSKGQEVGRICLYQ